MFQNLMFLALLPGILIIIYVYKKDKVESEPKKLIFKLVALGALSCVPAVFMETLIEAGSPASGTLTYAAYEAFVCAAFCEELCKFFFLWVGSWRNKAFDYRFDGIVYGVSTAVGFALLENILYVMEGGITTAIVRGIMAVPLHAFCGVFMGIFYGAMKKYSVQGNKGKVIQSFIGALLVPMLIHGIYDTCCFADQNIFTIILLIFVGFMYFISIKYTNKFESEDWQACFYTDTYYAGGQPQYQDAGRGMGGYVYVDPEGPAAGTPAKGEAVPPENLEKLRLYKSLYDKGAISSEEYEYWKKKLL